MHEVSAASLTAVSGHTARKSSTLVTTWPVRSTSAWRTASAFGVLVHESGEILDRSAVTGRCREAPLDVLGHGLLVEARERHLGAEAFQPKIVRD